MTIGQRLMLRGAEARLLEQQSAEGSAGADLAPRIDGYAARFDVLSEDLGGWRERIAPGAFQKAIPRDDVRALQNHDENRVLGRNTSGTLRLREDASGLVNEISPPDTSYFRDLRESMRRKDVTQQSFGFRARGYSWAKEDGLLVRTVRDLELVDVSIVTFPAYTQTSASVRAAVFETLPRELVTLAHEVVDAMNLSLRLRIYEADEALKATTGNRRE